MTHIERLRESWAPEAVAGRLSRYPSMAWLDSDGEGPGRWSRRSYLACDPEQVVAAAGGAADPWDAIGAMDEVGVNDESVPTGAPFDPARVPRWIGYLAYDLTWSGAYTEWKAPRHARDARQDVVRFGRYAAVLVYDHIGRAWWVVADDARAARRLVERAAGGDVSTRARMTGARVPDAALHELAIRQALDHIGRGNIYQVNLARRWRANLDGDSLALALAMRRASPVPFGFYLSAADHSVIGRTMELFLDWDRSSRRLVTRPIKGTIGREGTHDAAEGGLLLADPKERAEHAMIVDLMRNDLGRVAETASVRPTEIMVVEPYARLHHLVSTVQCTTRREVGLVELLQATFPPGSVTGTPKVRAVELIEELESEPRGVYTGAVGFVDRAGGVRLAVAIRTARVDHATHSVDYFAGGGIVAASVPAREVAETELKARAFLDAAADLESPRPNPSTSSHAKRHAAAATS